MYDSLIIDCPKCGKELEFQSKSGPCFLYTCNKSNLTPEIAVGMNGEIVRCQFCNKRIRLECIIPTQVKLRLVITKGKKFDYNGNYNPKHSYSIKRMKQLHTLFHSKLSKGRKDE